MSHVVPNKLLSHRPTSVGVGFFPVSLPVLSVCEVGCISTAFVTTPIISLMYIFSDCPLIMTVPVSPVYISAYALEVLLISLTSVLVFPSITTDLALPSKVSTFVYLHEVIDKADVFSSQLSSKGCVRAGKVAVGAPF